MAASALLACELTSAAPLEDALRHCAVPEASDLFGKLDSVRQLVDAFKTTDPTALSAHERVVQLLIEEVWHHTFMTYFAMERGRREIGQGSQ